MVSSAETVMPRLFYWLESEGHGCGLLVDHHLGTFSVNLTNEKIGMAGDLHGGSFACGTILLLGELFVLTFVAWSCRIWKDKYNPPA